MWIALTAVTGKPVWVNFDTVQLFGEAEEGGGAVISFGGDRAMIVKEKPTEVLILLAQFEDGEEPDEEGPGGKHAYGGVYN